MIGGLIDWLRGIRRRLLPGGVSAAQHSAAFTSAFIALAAKMAKADGVAVAAEWEAFEKLLEVPEGERANVRRLYDLAKQDTAGADEHASRIKTLLAGQPETLREVLECLLYVACSDGMLHPEEDTFLTAIASRLGFSTLEYRALRASFVRDPGSPYEVLGLSPDASDREVKKRYRMLAARSHPDRLIASGAPAAVIKAETARLAAINAAYERIEAERRGARAS